MLQALPLDVKIQKTKLRIREWYEYYGGNVYVSFSGGKDSTVLLHIVRSMYPDVMAAFVDTGLEYPEVRNYVKSVDNVVWIKPKMNFKQVILKYGYPLISKEVSQKIYEARKTPGGACDKRFDPNGEYATKYGGRFSMARWKWLKDSGIPISHMCCTIMKKNPAKKFEKETGLHPIIGTMTTESALRKSEWLKSGCNAFDSKRPTSKPLSFWSEQDIFEYIVRNDLKISEAYGEIVSDNKEKYYTTKCDRTGCVFCMFGVHLDKEPNRFQRLRLTHKKLWEYCMKPILSGGLGLKEVLEYIGVPIE